MKIVKESVLRTANVKVQKHALELEVLLVYVKALTIVQIQTNQLVKV